MNHLHLTTALLCFAASLATAQESIKPTGDANVSLKLEIERAIDRGVRHLESTQDQETGAWSDPTLPAFTALSIASILGDPALAGETELPASAEKGYDFLLSNVKPDGGIYGKGLATYNTALSIMALVQSGKEEHLPVIAKARRLLINQQQDYDKRGETDNLFDGGVGYGGSYAHSDLSNTHLALEALYYSKKALADTEYDDSSEFDLDWDAAIEFVSRTQNSKETIERLGEEVALRDEDEGGFIYFPGDTKSDQIAITGDDGKERTALRSYGSMSYAGLLAFIYADMDRDDPRIASVMSWLQKNFTLEENPGMDAQGLFYYYHTMSKALAITGTEHLVTPEGKKIDWKEDLALEVMSRQQSDGSWTNEESNRWMEDDAALVTAYSLLTLQHVYRAL
ncbi:MAG: cycloartenol synthase [Verrucomicrobiales bacterium]|nr:cycloartenol synthase [Verrucomicrobiales bacterium]